MGVSENMTFFSLNGDIEREELLSQLNGLHALGYDNFVLHARAGLKTKYLSDEWFALYRAVLEDGAQKGYKITVYDEYGWPSGFAGGAIAPLGRVYHAKYLHFSETPVNKENYRLLASYQKTNSGYRLSSKISGEGLFAYCVYDEKYVDIMSKAAVDAFISLVYQRYYDEVGEYFGSVINKIFTDEPAIMISYPVCPYAWSVALEEEYAREFGGDLLEDLWRLYLPDEYSFRHKYYLCTGNLYFRNFIAPLSTWCREHGVQWTGHLSSEDSVRHSYRAHGSTLLAYREFGVPGIDFLGKRIPSPVLMKQLTSVANQFGKKQLLCECFGGMGYDATWKDIVRTWNYLTAYGINTPCTHLSAYSLEGSRKRDFPLAYSYQMNGIEHFSQMLRRFKEGGEFVSKGRAKNSVLVLSPTLSCMGYERETVEEDDIAFVFRTLLENLNDVQAQYDLTDEKVLEKYARVQNGKIYIGEGEYSLLVLPYMPSIEPATLSFLEEYKRQGGKIVGVERYPTLCGFEKEERVEGLFLGEEPPIRNRAELWEIFFERRHGTLRRVRFIDEKGKTNPYVLLQTREDEGKIYVTLLNRIETGTLQGKLLVAREGQILFAEGQKESLCVHSNGEWTWAELCLQPGELAYLIFDKKTAIVPTEKGCKTVRTLRPQRVWAKEKNTLLVDRARVSFDGKNFGEELAILPLNEYVRKSLQKVTEVVVRYSFTSAIEGVEAEIFSENAACRMQANGADLPLEEEYFIDKAIRSRGKITLRKGENTVDLYCPVQPIKAVDREFGAETDVNSQELGREIEAIYVRGEFCVASRQIEEAGGCNRHFAPFVLQSAKPLCAGEITSQGMPFYRGSLRYEFTYTAEKVEEEYLRLGNFHAAFAAVYVNGEYVCALPSGSERAAIAEYLHAGENSIAIDLYTTDKNVFGPFHHAWGGTRITSPLTFEGKFCIGEYVDGKEVCRPEEISKQTFLTEGYRLDKLFLDEIFIEKEEG